MRISDVSDVIDKLRADKVSPAAEHVWEWFWDLKAGSQNGWTETVTFSDIETWSRLCNVSVKPWETRALIRMGLIFHTTRAEKETSSGKN